jgi:hypothetical protein
MKPETDAIGIYPEHLAFESKYVPLISFRNEDQKQSAENYITKEVDDFFDKLYVFKKPLYQAIPYSQLITEKDFKTVDIDYFYLKLFYDIRRNDKKELDISRKYSVTFDEKLTPIQLAWIWPNPRGEEIKPSVWDKKKNRKYRKYGTIDINGEPVFYYIYFTLQEILDVIKEL